MAADVSCNCVIVWDPIQEQRVWIRDFMADCSHPATGITPRSGFGPE